jgi:hypothetical protein
MVGQSERLQVAQSAIGQSERPQVAQSAVGQLESPQVAQSAIGQSKRPHAAQSAVGQLSIVVPVGPNDPAWRALLVQLQDADERVEIILVFAQNLPSDIAPQTDKGAVIRAVQGTPGRAAQMNLGASLAQAEMIWFLHADSTLYDALEQALRKREAKTLYFFALRFVDGPWLLRFNEIGVYLRTRFWGMPFGDQGFLMHARSFAQLGGFDESLPHGEDHHLAWRAKAWCYEIEAINATLGTSGRRYAEHGWLRTTLHYSQLAFAQAKQFRGTNAKNHAL